MGNVNQRTLSEYRLTLISGLGAHLESAGSFSRH